MYYELQDLKNPTRLTRDFLGFGISKQEALSFIIMHYTVNDVLCLEAVTTAHEINRAMPDHHEMMDVFDRADIEFTWDYLVKNRLLKPVTGH